MRARISLSLLLSCSLIVLLAPFSPAQIHGTPSSVTSFGFGGNFNPAPGVPASVTSLGPNGFGNGFDCCFRPGFSNHPRPFRDHQLRDHERFPIGLSVPVFVPYAVPYPVYAEAETGDDDSVDADSTYRRGVPPVYDRGYRDAPKPRHAPHDAAPKAAAPEDAAEPPEPVVAPSPPPSSSSRTATSLMCRITPSSTGLSSTSPTDVPARSRLPTSIFRPPRKPTTTVASTSRSLQSPRKISPKK